MLYIHSLPNTKQSFSLDGLKIQYTLLQCCGSLKLTVSWLPTPLHSHFRCTQIRMNPPFFPISSIYHSQQNPTQISGLLASFQFLEGYILLVQTKALSSEARGYSPRDCKFQQASLHLGLCKTDIYFAEAIPLSIVNSLTFCRNRILVASPFHFSLLPCSCSLVNASAY